MTQEKSTRQLPATWAVGVSQETHRVICAIAEAEHISNKEVVRRGVEAYAAIKAMEDAAFGAAILEVRA
jgi:hypothetical protein